MMGKLVVAGAVAAVGLGVSAAGASAYSLLGGAYLTTPSATHAATVAGSVYTVSCGAVEFEGAATGLASTDFVASHSGCGFFGFPATVTQSGDWQFTVIGTNGAGIYFGRIDIPAGASSTFDMPMTGCTVVVSGPQSVVHGFGDSYIEATNSGGGLEVGAVLNGLVYTASGCPFSSGADLTYDTGGVIEVPGVAAS